MSHTVRTTMQPDLEIEVGDAEFLDLKRQGLLVDDAPEPAPQAAAPAVASTPKKTTGAAGSKES